MANDDEHFFICMAGIFNTFHQRNFSESLQKGPGFVIIPQMRKPRGLQFLVSYFKRSMSKSGVCPEEHSHRGCTASGVGAKEWDVHAVAVLCRSGNN